MKKCKFHGDFDKFLQDLEDIAKTPDPAEIVYCDNKTCKEYGNFLDCYTDKCYQCRRYIMPEKRKRWFERRV